MIGGGRSLILAALVLLGGCGLEDEGEPTSDAGEPCTDISQCEGWCEAPADAEPTDTGVVGTCSEVREAECYDVIEDGVYTAIVCEEPDGSVLVWTAPGAAPAHYSKNQ